MIMNGRIAYRILSKTVRDVFKNDAFALSKARNSLRVEFVKFREVKDKKEIGID